MGIRHVRLADLPAAVDVLARSFYDDPQMQWLLPDPVGRLDQLRTMFGLIAAAGHRRGHTYLMAEGDEAVAASVWTPPDVEPFSDDETGPFGEFLYGAYGDEGIGRLGAMVEAMGEHHPTDPHFYLFIVGVSPDHQGRGLGEQLLAPTIGRADAEGTPMYLESSNPRNIGFYRRLGFEIHAEFHPEGGPLFTGMWREPRG